MTHARIAELLGESAPSRVRPPELCRLTILARHTQVDLAVPADVPVALLVPGIVDMIRAHGNTNEFDDAPEQHEPEEWVLARMGEPPLESTSSLREHDVRDGDLLMLESAAATAPPPLYDDIMYTVATADSERDRRWDPATARLAGSIVAVVAVAIGCFALLWAGVGTGDVVGGVCALFVAMLFLIAGTIVARMYGDRKSAVVLGGCALPTSFTAGVLFVPGAVSAAHWLLGSVLAGACAVLALRVSGVGVALFTTVAAAAALVVPATLVALLTDQPARAIGAGLAALALAGLALSPRISMLLAALPLPHVPAPGTSVDPAEDEAAPLPSFTELAALAQRARSHLTGLLVATTAVTVGAVLVAAAPTDGIYWQGTVLAVLCAAVLMFRGRTFANAQQAVVLLAGGATLLLVLLLGAAITTGAALALFGLAIAAAVAALVLGILAPVRTFTPPLRRSVELLEYGCIAAILPMAIWVTGLYGIVRGL